MPSRDFSVCSSHLRPQAAHRSHLGDLGVSIGLRRSLWNAALCLGYPRLTRVHISFEPWPFYLRDKSQNVTPKRELLWVAVSICSVTSSLERNCQESFFQTFFFKSACFRTFGVLGIPIVLAFFCAQFPRSALWVVWRLHSANWSVQQGRMHVYMQACSVHMHLQLHTACIL